MSVYSLVIIVGGAPDFGTHKTCGAPRPNELRCRCVYALTLSGVCMCVCVCVNDFLILSTIEYTFYTIQNKYIYIMLSVRNTKDNFKS